MKTEDGNIDVQRAKMYQRQPEKKVDFEDEKQNSAIDFRRNDKLVNFIYNDGAYHLYEP